ncbi:MerR family DNA-binding protein [Knoellia koreensis]|uniref:MerR family DNA-binding protein n=1 Tax=Knoellia koreensis TaxID=2730921 RepID=UPI003211D8DF
MSELAAAVGVAPDTVRYYERAGLLPAQARTPSGLPSGYRSFDETALDRIRFIQGAQRLGLRLSDIRDLLTIRDTGQCPCEPAEQLLRGRLAELDAQMTRLANRRTDMANMLAALPTSDCPPPTSGTWCPPAKGGDPDTP